MSGSPTAAALTIHSDPHQDRAASHGDAPSRTGRLLGLVRKLIDYGKGLASTLRQGASATSLADATLNFGTIDIGAILARITRALLCAAALEARLISGAARRDAGPARTDCPSHPQPRATQPANLQADGTGSRLARLRTPGDIAAAVRRRPIGAVIADICRDLGIVPGHPLWRELSFAIIESGGDLVALFKDVLKRVHTANASSSAIDPSEWPAPPPGWPAPHPPSPAASGAGPP
jgi:hypothetical protein